MCNIKRLLPLDSKYSHIHYRFTTVKRILIKHLPLSFSLLMTQIDHQLTHSSYSRMYIGLKPVEHDLRLRSGQGGHICIFFVLGCFRFTSRSFIFEDRIYGETRDDH